MKKALKAIGIIVGIPIAVCAVWLVTLVVGFILNYKEFEDIYYAD